MHGKELSFHNLARARGLPTNVINELACLRFRLETQYGTGYPVAFQNGEGRLPAHFGINAALGREAARGRLGYELSVDNLLDHRYLIKVNNGFNTTQWNAPRRIVFRVTAPW